MQSAICLLLAVSSAGVFASDGGYAAPAAQPPQQGYPSQQPIYYQPVFQPAQYALPNYDVNYCTVHASFPIVDRHRKNYHNRDRRQTGYDTSSYQPVATYGAYPQPFGDRPSRRFDRQFCRHSAIFSQAACNTCCQISSRAAGNNAVVSGALFVFDPKIKEDRRDSFESGEEQKEENEEKRVLQCVCCMPRSV